MNKYLSSWIQRFWYKEMYLSSFFMPLSMIYLDIMRLRRFLYRIGVYKSARLPVPVIIVGNITVGGTGKTPLVIYLVELLQKQGLKVGVISRGYQGEEKPEPRRVSIGTNPALVGDEALLLAKHCACPVVVCADRVAAGRYLLMNSPVDVIISDDGMQHYALQRDIEIAVIDGSRRFGNGYCLPVGPLREPQERLQEVDFVVVNGGKNLEPGEWAMRCIGIDCVNMQNGEIRSLASFRGQDLHAVAAIGNPQRFFRQLQQAGLNITAHEFPDHHAFTQQELNFSDQLPILMTEKDAVKCQAFANAQYWYLPIKAELDSAFATELLTLLTRKQHG